MRENLVYQQVARFLFHLSLQYWEFVATATVFQAWIRRVMMCFMTTLQDLRWISDQENLHNHIFTTAVARELNTGALQKCSEFLRRLSLPKWIHHSGINFPFTCRVSARSRIDLFPEKLTDDAQHFRWSLKHTSQPARIKISGSSDRHLRRTSRCCAIHPDSERFWSLHIKDEDQGWHETANLRIAP